MTVFPLALLPLPLPKVPALMDVPTRTSDTVARRVLAEYAVGSVEFRLRLWLECRKGADVVAALANTASDVRRLRFSLRQVAANPLSSRESRMSRSNDHNECAWRCCTPRIRADVACSCMNLAFM